MSAPNKPAPAPAPAPTPTVQWATLVAPTSKVKPPSRAWKARTGEVLHCIYESVEATLPGMPAAEAQPGYVVRALSLTAKDGAATYQATLTDTRYVLSAPSIHAALTRVPTGVILRVIYRGQARLTTKEKRYEVASLPSGTPLTAIPV